MSEEAVEYLIQELEKHTPEQKAEYLKILQGSAAAAPTTNTVNPVHTEQTTILSNKDSERQRKWFQSGVKAKQKGYSNTSPFYENKTADYFFKCGYEGATFAQAQEALTEKIKDFLEQDSTVLETVNELVK